MSDTSDRKKTGRKPLEISQKVVEGMASVGATDIEIAQFCECSVDTITRRFADILTKRRAGMKTKLRRAQFKLALDGNATMQIWLGKQILGQKDQTNLEITRADIADLTDEELERVVAGTPISKVLAGRARA